MSVQQHKPGQPVVGFNHNVGYKGRTFHVQTEDSGPQHGHVITHIFLGGNILASTKSSYADRLPGWEPGEVFAQVRALMEAQHKAMLKALLAGTHDAEIARRSGGAVYEPGVLAGGAKSAELLVGGDKGGPEPRAAKLAPAPAPPPAAPNGPLLKPAPVTPPRPRTAPTPSPRQPPPARQPLPRPAPLPSAPLPTAPRAPTPNAMTPPPGWAPARSNPPASRPAPSRPAPPAPAAPPPLFGEGLVSDKSLDEVILSYLAADLDSGDSK